MRRLAVLLLGSLTLVAFAGSASALPLDVNPLGFEVTSGGGALVASGDIHVTVAPDDRINILFDDVLGDVAGVRVRLMRGDQFVTPIAAGHYFGPDVDVVDGFTDEDLAGFVFAKFLVRDRSDRFFVEYGDLLQAGDMILFDIFNSTNLIIASGVKTQVVPEPGTAMLLVLGLGGLALSGRRRFATA